jgi:uncharacterized protein YgfB (UPF0149 family)
VTLVNTETGEVVDLLTKDEAQALTAKIKSYAGVLSELLVKAHDGQAWRALGYATWGEYIATEFDMSRSRAYQLISHARFVAELDAGSVSTNVDNLTEGETRGLGPVVGEVKAKIAEEVGKLEDPTDEDRATVTHEVVTHFKQRNAAKRADIVPPRPTPEPPARVSPERAAPVPAPAETDPPELRKRLSRSVDKQTDLLRLDPSECAAVVLPDDRDEFLTLADDMTTWAAAFRAGLTQPLRSVQ